MDLCPPTASSSGVVGHIGARRVKVKSLTDLDTGTAATDNWAPAH
ncbi:MAG: hypothetical protein ABSF12_25255 [Bryobacteraceae bacterium]|jgi:hypothetical protein